MTYAEAALIMMSGGGKEPVLENLTVTENGVYTPDEGVDGFNKVTVNVLSEQPDIQELTVTSNGTYYAENYGCDGFDPVNVNVDDGSEKIAELEQNIDDIFEQLEKYLETGETGNIPANDRNLGVMTKFKRLVSGEGAVTVEDSESEVKIEFYAQPHTAAPNQWYLFSTVTYADSREERAQYTWRAIRPDGEEDYFDPHNIISVDLESISKNSVNTWVRFRVTCAGNFRYYGPGGMYTETMVAQFTLSSPNTFGSGNYVIL